MACQAHAAIYSLRAAKGGGDKFSHKHTADEVGKYTFQSLDLTEKPLT